jgi:uncharacterized protein (TIGR03435 family)
MLETGAARWRSFVEATMRVRLGMRRGGAPVAAEWIAGLCCLIAAATLHAQEAQSSSPPPAASEPAPSFEVASVKKSGPPSPGSFNFNMRGGRFVVSQTPLSSLITMAYSLQRYQVVGGPAWINSDRFDVNAKAEDGPVAPTPPGTPTRQQLMLRALLKERFALVAHNETRELPLSHLVMSRDDRKLGERLRPATVDCAALAAARGRAGGPPPVPPAPPKPGEVPQCGMRGGFGQIAAGSMRMEQLASLLASMLNRPVFDRTKLTGAFDFQLDYTPDQMPQLPPGATLPPGFTMPSADGPSLSTALQEQLGLKLESTRGPIEVLVIDSVSQPTPD